MPGGLDQIGPEKPHGPTPPCFWLAPLQPGAVYHAALLRYVSRTFRRPVIVEPRPPDKYAPGHPKAEEACRGGSQPWFLECLPPRCRASAPSWAGLLLHVRSCRSNHAGVKSATLASRSRLVMPLPRTAARFKRSIGPFSAAGPLMPMPVLHGAADLCCTFTRCKGLRWWLAVSRSRSLLESICLRQG
jgi:hypothetical protein